jgi:hypothetical protein
MVRLLLMVRVYIHMNTSLGHIFGEGRPSTRSLGQENQRVACQIYRCSHRFKDKGGCQALLIVKDGVPLKIEGKHVEDADPFEVGRRVIIDKAMDLARLNLQVSVYLMCYLFYLLLWFRSRVVRSSPSHPKDRTRSASRLSIARLY